MKIVHSLPHPVRVIENLWIPLPDGGRLAARVWLPVGAEARPVPAVVESIPYRKRDVTRARDEPMHGYFAGHGYAAVRIDLRGAGDSDGVLRDEYLPREQEDGVAALRWIAEQPWCNGAVGMIGKSWGGFGALQIAALRPPELKAIITVCSTDDRYADDAHFMGGCLLNENLIWGSLLLTINAQPPDPEIVGERWRDMWRERLEHNRPFPAVWLRHQRRDDYWKQGSVCEDFGRIACPVFAVGGWADGYTNAVPRLLAGLTVPRKGLVGPWAHLYPHEGVPGPAIGFLQEAVRWWDRWLKGIDNGVMDEPLYRVWMQESVPPRSFYDERPGRWVAEDVWPSPRIESRRYVMTAAGLAEMARDPETRFLGEAGFLSALDVSSPQDTGLAAGAWCSFGIAGELPTDQRADDGKSLTFDSPPLPEPLEILGAPAVTLSLSVDHPVAMVAVRLNDVAPDGASTRVTYGLLNLTHRDSHERPAPLEPGRRYTVRVPLNEVAHRFAAGNRLRVAVSTSYWPVTWPAPEPVVLTLWTEASELELPVRPLRPEDEFLPPFLEPEGAPGPESIDLHPGGVRRTIQRDLTTGETLYTTSLDFDDAGEPSLTRLPAIGLKFGHGISESFRIHEKDPLAAATEVVHRTLLRRGEWQVRVETRTTFSATKDEFHLRCELRAFEGATEVFARTWDERIARDLV